MIQHMFYRWLLLLPLGFLLACGQTTEQEGEAADRSMEAEGVVVDPHSYARPAEAVIDHLDLNLKVNFDEQVLSGYARYRIRNLVGTDSILFDVYGLNIERVTLGEEESPTSFTLGPADEMLGSALAVAIEPNTEIVTIHYRTNPEQDIALDWLTATQTLDKQQPFLFTQGQAILTRSWIPIQDSPGIRITYDATIEVPPGMLAVMSAENPQERNESGRYTFRMQQSIPPYLLALAAGDIVFQPLSERTGVYAEPGMIERAAYELADVEKMVAKTEEIFGAYPWERYDIIVLPPSFPFGGMENPRLTFATPTIIAGDRSLTSLIAHELAHSWSGNLVTNATWNDFWLNEGLTTYTENRIMEALYGKEYASMLAMLGYQDLEGEVEALGQDSPDTHLKLNLAGRNPDDGMTDIAYEKGAHFFRLLERTAGRERFDAFLKQYFADYRFKTVTTEEFITYLREKLLEPENLDIDLNTWIYGPGIPDNVPLATSSRFDSVDMAIQRFTAGSPPARLKTKEWSTQEWLHFIRHLPTDLPAERMASLDKAYGFTKSGNSEIQAAWYELAIRNGYVDKIMPSVEAFLVEVGRRKFLTPLYGALKESGRLNDARRIFDKAAPGYHAVSRTSIEQLLARES